MMAVFTQEDWVGIVSVIGAIAAAYGASRLDMSRQTAAIKKAVRHIRQEMHADLEEIRLRVGAVERSVERLKGRGEGGYRYLPPNGGDPEAGHLPPTPGGQGPLSA